MAHSFRFRIVDFQLHEQGLARPVHLGMRPSR